MKKCNTCYETLALEDFVKDKRCAEGRRNICKKCYVGYRRGTVYKAKYSHSIVKQKFLQKLRDRPCFDCHQKYHYTAMDFDHLRDKEFSIMSSYKYKTFEEIVTEVAKCDIVCANCHRVRTHLRRLQVL